MLKRGLLWVLTTAVVAFSDVPSVRPARDLDHARHTGVYLGVGGAAGAVFLLAGGPKRGR